MHKTIVLWLALLSPWICNSLAAQTMTDTLWSVPELDGSIGFRPGSGIFSMTTSSSGFFPGDGFDVFLQEDDVVRDYLSFQLSDLSITDTLSIIQATIGIYQENALGNGRTGTYPIWNVAGGDTHFCVLDHIDYGGSLDLGDWTAGDPGDPQTLQTNIGIISSDTTTGYKVMDVTRYVQSDVANERIYNQYRMRFTIDTDWDHLGDFLILSSGNSILDDKPYLIVRYNVTGINQSTFGIRKEFELRENYPNPFNPITTIAYTINRSGKVELSVFDILGKKVKGLVNTRQPTGTYSIQFDGSDLPSGVYWYRLKFEDDVATKKMLLIR
ncbi:MAG: T9SS type A sorting domain-containing protein [Aliifodinibius sp.]|nr:T9SS type A sorting domain-containing protein [Fodinibius sp.]NIV11940.1 T9SS type A sorting domain-containing protein [Fodinibius sp.]NIY25576.1 T9SS type A sorting domain-containing protein [Fodinibius sp.]